MVYSIYFQKIFNYILITSKGLREEGILRISGQKSVIEQMKHEIEEGFFTIKMHYLTY